MNSTVARRAVSHGMAGRPPARILDPRTGPLELRRSWPRGPGCISLELVGESGQVVAGQWIADRDALAARAAATPAPAFLVPGARVLLQPSGADRRLRALRRYLARPGTVLVAHRPERRAVVRRLRLPDGGADRGMDGDPVAAYVKFVRPGRSAALVEAATRLAQVAGGAFRVPMLLRHEPGQGLVEWSALSGRTLEQLGADPGVPDRVFAEAWRSTGRAVAALHDAPWDAAWDAACPRHDAAAEVEGVGRWLDPAAAYGLLPPVDLDALLAELVGGTPGPMGMLHRDLHDKQVLVSGPGPPGLLDADTAAAGERAVDVANLLVHLELRVAQGLLAPRRAALAREEFLTALGAEPATLARVPAYARATRLRLAGVYAFRPRWRGASAAMLTAGTRP